jgi:hypothetical protein
MSQQSEIRIPVGDVTVEGSLSLLKTPKASSFLLMVAAAAGLVPETNT